MKAAKNIFWLSLSRAFSLVLLFLAYASLFRYLGPENSGKYQFVLSYVLMFAIISDFGIQQFITKKISENPERKEEYFKEFIRFEIFLSTLLFVFLVSLAYLRGFEKQIFFGVALAGFGMSLNTLCYPFLSVMSAAQDLRKVALINFINSLVNVGIIFLTIIFNRGIVFLSSVQLVFGIIDFVLYKIFIKKHLPDLKILDSFKSFSFRTIKNILKNGWPFVLLVGFSAVYNRVDVIILAKLLDFTQVGLYTAAYKFFDLLSFFPAIVSHTLFPIFAASMAQGLILEVRENLEKYLRLMLALSLPLGVGGCILAKPLITLVAGQEYAMGAKTLSIIIWAIAILFIYIPLNSLVISQLTRKAALITGINVFVNIAGNLILIPKFGIISAAAMTVLSEFLQGIFYFLFVRKYITNFSFFTLAAKPFFAALVMGVLLWQIKEINIVLALVSGILTYFTVLMVSGFAKVRFAICKANISKFVKKNTPDKILVFGTFDVLHKGHLSFFKQARRLSKNPYLIVSVARDINVARIKKKLPTNSEKKRLEQIKKNPLVNKAVLGAKADYLSHIYSIAPHIIALGYDQKSYTKNLQTLLAKNGFKPKIYRLKPFFPHVYKTSLLKNVKIN